MKRQLTLAAVFFFAQVSLFGQADTATSTPTTIDSTTYVFGNVMYEGGTYYTAINVYEELLRNNGPAKEIYYNLGNAYYKINNLGNAVLNYERALYLDHGYRDAKYNLTLTNTRLRDNIDAENKSIFVLAWEGFIHWFSANTWTVLAILFIWIALIGLAAYLIEKFKAYQRLGFYTFSIGLILFLLSFIGALGRNSFDNKYQYAIVMEPSAVIKSEPSENSKNLFLIHEGFKLQLQNSDGEWQEIKMPNGVKGWVKQTAITPVSPFTVE